MDKVLSVIIAAYNVEAYLENTLRSCVLEDHQLQEDYEIIVVNDGSRDGTSDIARKYVEQYPKVFRVIDKTNGGYGSVINEGIKNATGKYFKLLDGDDWYSTEALAEFIQYLKNCDSDMVLTNYVMVHEGSGKRDVFQCNGIKSCERLPAEELLKLTRSLAMHGICYKTEILQKLPMPITENCFYTDTEYVIYGAAYVKTIIYYPIDLYQYRIGREGQSVSVEGLVKHIGDLERVIKDIDSFYDVLQKEENRELVNYRIALTYRVYVTYLLLLPGSKERLQKIKVFDREIEEKYPDRFRLMENKKIRILRSTKYKAYRLCRLYCKWEKNRDER